MNACLKRFDRDFTLTELLRGLPLA
ncbi:MAG: hypothetical protein JWR25_1855, partial [Noviherbaspirillum sp.]|nr:hypothetical protein [Noviherbaspirillum sp.]